MTGKIKGTDYDAEFRSLYHNYSICKDSIPNFLGIEKFIKKYQLDHCQTAYQRILSGQSAYIGEPIDQGLVIRVMDITQKMIGAIDLLEINIYDNDQVYPAVL